MSLLKSIANFGRSVLSNPIATKMAAAIPGIGTGIALAGTAYQAYSSMKTPSVGGGNGGGIMTLPPMSTSFSAAGMLSPQAVGRGAAVLVKGARAIPRAAISLCRKYPQWCSTIGGTVAVEALMNSGQLPPPKRRRGKGISAHELRAFKRVARFTSKYCAPVHRAMKAPAVRHGGKSCR